MNCRQNRERCDSHEERPARDPVLAIKESRFRMLGFPDHLCAEMRTRPDNEVN
jgi:hypothetical protein